MRTSAAAALAFSLLAAPLFAHDASMNGLVVALSAQKVSVTLSSHVYKLRPALGLPEGELTTDQYRNLVRDHVHLLLDGKVFRPGSPPVISLDTETGVLSLTVEQAGSARTVEVTGLPFPQIFGSKCAVIVLVDGAAAGEGLLDAEHPSYLLRTPSWTDTGGRYFVLGLEHIFTGLDHLLFVAALVLLGGGLKRQVKIVTAFTLAHSVTLALAATGVFILPSFLVEPAIALSITVVALENLRQRPAGPERHDLRPWLALAFGLVHGFGFAGALAETGLPRVFLPAALGFFNLGVEAGQLSLVLVLVPLLAAGRRRLPGVMPRALTSASVVIGLVGLVWFVQRVAA